MTLELQIITATDPALTADNWQHILDVCDTILSDPETNIPAAIKLVRGRLGQKDANIVLRALTLLVAMGENCGSRMQQEIASLLFLKDCLLSRLADRKVHKELKFRIAEVIEQLDKSFKKDPSLKAVSDAYATVQSKYLQYLKSPPSKPAKTEMTTQDRKNEDLELERALKLSVQEYEREQSIRKLYLDSKPLPSPLQAGEKDGNQHKNTVTIASVKKVVALYDLISYEPDELSFRKGDVITVIESVYRDWWRGSLPTGKVGIFPLNYVSPVVSKTPEELAREHKLETALMEIESKKVDRLLALLSMDPNTVLEEEVTELYNSIVPLKPVLAQLIEKHSSRRDELRALNDQMNTETKIYNSLIDNMISQRQNMQLNYSLPYPAHAQLQYPQQSQAQHQHQATGPSPSQPGNQAQQLPVYGNYLEQQPTSAGFGNGANYGGERPNEYTGAGQQYPQSSYRPQTSFPQSQNYRSG
ncbi:hypothetical protein METBIDRAFT_34230 [Metschnikowia bicuspidata var. bicuspidata NRRL YB-4993]|uniref:Class E vacuolar protein-sorting machinery protein HSE1 n=1 Tax=Metschnikowia bicuspidata var. bicuspidata NRRL YB-4993 TaxID=869754 RepID=A0A1A0HH52_9ASCO|nr:hypothetical protein METBIDRAFT_34230 [Metschnikowia bicuspidata var. bicuspidata NRRL YB-4993]OBA23207.1 hypothetical protein METBIDRAFT_34230 [Metschnikowia bicuspidata var. bicuspidata NRRL YB-4993]